MFISQACCDWDCRKMTKELIIYLLLHTLQLYVCACVCMCVCVLSHVQLFATPWTVALPGSSVHEIFQARILEWLAIFYSWVPSQLRD